MKALVGAFNQEKALVGAFSVIVQPVVEPMDRFTALVIMFRHGKPHLLSPMTDHYNLSLWITSTIGLAKLAAQFYFYQFNIVHI